MTDYGHQLEFGYFLIPEAGDPHWATVLSRLALELGFGTFILTTPPDPEVLRTFIDDVAPEVRSRVAAGRSRASLESRVLSADATSR